MWTNCNHNIFLAREEHTHMTSSQIQTSLGLILATCSNHLRLGFQAQETKTTLQMMADHGDPCNGQESSYCMNGGTCYKISSMNTLSCVCNENFKGSRCEHFQLFTFSPDAKKAGLIAAMVIVALLILVVVAVVIYYVRKMLKAKKKNQKNNHHEYWRVRSRV